MAEVSTANGINSNPVAKGSIFKIVECGCIAVVKMNSDVVQLAGSRRPEHAIFIGPAAIGLHNKPQFNLIAPRA